MDFFSSLAKDIGKFVEEVSDTIQETVAEIANADDFYETRNEPTRRSTAEIKEDLNEWTLLEDPVLPSEEVTNSKGNANGPTNSNSSRSLSGKKKSSASVASGEYSERMVRVPQERGLAGWLEQGQWMDGAWDSAENKERFRQLLESKDAQSKVELARCSFEYGIPFEYKLRVYRRLLPTGNYLNQEQFQALKNQHLRDGIPKSVLEDIADDMKFANKIKFFHEMEVFDILEEVLYLVYLTQFSGPEDNQKKKARKARKEKLDLDQQYPQGLAYVCCPLLFLLLRQESSDDANEQPADQQATTEASGTCVARKNSSGGLGGGDSLASSGVYVLSESQKIIARPAHTQEEKIIKRKLIDFYLEKVQLDLYNLVASLYHLKDSGFIALHQNPLEYVFALNDVLDDACPEITHYLNSMEVDLSGTCFSWMAHVLLPHWEKLQLALQFWDRYVVVLREAGLFHACVCASALIFLKRKLLEQNTPEYIQCFLQHPPLADVTAAELDGIVHEALRLFRDRKKGSGGISFEDYTIGVDDAKKPLSDPVAVSEETTPHPVAEIPIAAAEPEQKQSPVLESVEEKKPETAVVESSEVKHEEKIAEPEVQEEAPKDEARDELVSEGRVEDAV